MVGHLAARDLLFDELLHFAQRFEDAEIQIAPIDERPHDLRIQLGVLLRRAQRPRLDVRVPFPVATVLRQIVLERCETAGKGPGIAERPQPHIDPEHEAVDGRRRQQTDQRLPESQEELIVADRCAVIGFAALGEQEDQVDVR